MNCKKCGNRSTADSYFVCENCYSMDRNLPTNVKSSDWIRINGIDEQVKFAGKEKLRNFILTSYYTDDIVSDRKRSVVVIGNKMEILVTEDTIDKLAKESGLLSGKWTIYKPEGEINETWKIIASSTAKKELGTNAKVSTPLQIGSSKTYVICVYTKNYFNLDDVNRVRKRLKEFGFSQKLYYKPDIYTYLNIYSGTFPNMKASRYSE
ncbi:MAG: putative phosphothreonine lyase domain-containing protein [Nitrososphaerales archaeon]